MSDVQLTFIPKFEQSERIKTLEARNRELGTNGMPVYTDAAVKYVASLLKAGYYNEMSGTCNSLIYNTFVASNGSRTIRNTSADGFSDNFRNAKTYANIKNAYDLAWYL